MPKITVSEAVKTYPVTQASLYRDLKKGVLSFDYNAKNVKVIDVAELQRVYGKPSENTDPILKKDSHALSMRDNENQQKIATLEKQVQELKEQITTERAEKAKLFDLAERLQRQTEQLMLPKPTSPNLFQRVVQYFRSGPVMQKKQSE